MRYQKFIKLDNGDKLSVVVNFYDADKPAMRYRVELSRCKKGKRLYLKPYDEDSYRFRELSMEQRAESVKFQIIEILGVEEYNRALIECWETLKPF